MRETRLPSGDPLSTRTQPEEGTRGTRIEIGLFGDEDQTIEIGLFDEEELLEENDDHLIADSDLHR